MNRLLATTTLLGMLAFGPAMPAVAQDVCTGNSDPNAYRLQQSMALAEAMPKTQGSGPWPYIFHQRTVEVSYAEGQRLVLSGPPEGLRTDDLAEIHVIPSGQHWEHDFRDAAHTRIDVLMGEQDLSHLFTPGTNQLTLTLTDVLGPEWSTSAYTLLVMEPCNPQATMATTELASALEPPGNNDPPQPGEAAQPTLEAVALEATPVAQPSAPSQAMPAQEEASGAMKHGPYPLSSVIMRFPGEGTETTMAIWTQEAAMARQPTAVSTPQPAAIATQPAASATLVAAPVIQPSAPGQTMPAAKGVTVWPYLLLAVLGGAIWLINRRRAQLRPLLFLLREKAIIALRMATPYAQNIWKQLKAELQGNAR
jgi:hypothetical protein